MQYWKCKHGDNQKIHRGARMKKEAKLELVAKEIDEDKRYGLFLRAFQIGLEQLGITDIYFAPREVSKNAYSGINREDDKLVFTMVRESNIEEQG